MWSTREIAWTPVKLIQPFTHHEAWQSKSGCFEHVDPFWSVFVRFNNIHSCDSCVFFCICLSSTTVCTYRWHLPSVPRLDLVLEHPTHVTVGNPRPLDLPIGDLHDYGREGTCHMEYMHVDWNDTSSLLSPSCAILNWPTCNALPCCNTSLNWTYFDQTKLMHFMEVCTMISHSVCSGLEDNPKDKHRVWVWKFS